MDAVARVERLNERFRRDPWDPSVAWSESGMPADAGVLVHGMDGREMPGQPWRPGQPSRPELTTSWTDVFLKQSASYVYAAQQASNYRGMHLYPAGMGVILRPGEPNRIFCGFGGASAGHGVCQPVSETCRPGCSANALEHYCSSADYDMWNEPDNQGGQCGGHPWKPADFGDFLRHARTATQYNEIIIDSRLWIENLPASVEFLLLENTGDQSVVERAKTVHAHFLAMYNVSMDEYPLVALNPANVSAPFQLWHEHFEYYYGH